MNSGSSGIGFEKNLNDDRFIIEFVYFFIDSSSSDIGFKESK